MDIEQLIKRLAKSRAEWDRRAEARGKIIDRRMEAIAKMIDGMRQRDAEQKRRDRLRKSK